MPTFNWGNLPADSAAERKALAAIGESDIAKLKSFFASITESGIAPKAGGGVVEVTGAQAKRLLLTNNVVYNTVESGYYVGAKRVAAEVVKATAQAAVNQASANIGVLATRATSGTVQIAELYPAVVDGAKQSVMSSISLAHGGIDQTPAGAWKRGAERMLELIEGRAKTDTQRGFAGIRKVCEAIAKGAFDNDLQGMGDRLTNFTATGRIIYENENALVNAEAGRTKVVRILAGSINHCPSCLEIAAQGVRDNDGSDPIGGDYCQNSCYCIEVFLTENGTVSDGVQKSIDSANEKLAVQQQLDAQRMNT